MKCPRCSFQDTRVVDSREGGDGTSVRRRRACEKCEFRFTTLERLLESLPLVVKKGGQRETFDREKILNGLRKACEKRPISVLQMEEMAKSVEARLLEDTEREVSSVDLGEMVIEKLREVDQVAYVRFASVYRNFSDVNEFTETLRDLMKTKLSNKRLVSKSRGSHSRASSLPIRQSGVSKDDVSADLSSKFLNELSLGAQSGSTDGPLAERVKRDRK